MLYCIVGKSGSGKDSLARILKENEGLKPVCSYTSRAIRAGEIDGREHHFITRSEAEKILKERADEVVARTEINGNLYFALKEDLACADLYVIDPKGIQYLQSNFPDIKIYQIYVYCRDDIARERAAARGDDMAVYDARHTDESAMFDAYYNGDTWNTSFNNSDSYEYFCEQIDMWASEVLRK